MSAAAVQDPFILRCDGALTLATATHWRDQLRDALDRHSKVLVDVGGADDIDVTFVQLLVAARKTADATGKRVGVYPVSAKLDGAYVAEKDFPSREAAPTAAAPQTVDDIDRTALDTLIGEIGAPAVQQSLDVFFGEMAARLAVLRNYTDDANNAAVARETHLLKGTAGTFGLKQLAAEVMAFEREAQALEADAYAAALNRMTDTLSRSQSALQLMVGSAA